MSISVLGFALWILPRRKESSGTSQDERHYLLESSIALSRGDPVADESGKHSWVLQRDSQRIALEAST